MLIVILFNIPFAAKFQKLNLAKTDFSCAPHTIQERTSRHFEKPDAWNMWRQSIRCERPAFSVCSGDQMSLRRIVPKRLIQYEFSRDSIHSFCFSLSLSLFPPATRSPNFSTVFPFYLWAGHGICAQNSGVSKESQIGAGNEWKFRALFFPDDNIRITGEIRGDATREKSLINF